jgi:hypothetical protein
MMWMEQAEPTDTPGDLFVEGATFRPDATKSQILLKKNTDPWRVFPSHGLYLKK